MPPFPSPQSKRKGATAPSSKALRANKVAPSPFGYKALAPPLDSVPDLYTVYDHHAGDPDQLLDLPDVRQHDVYSCGAACALSVTLAMGVGESTELWPKRRRDWWKPKVQKQVTAALNKVKKILGTDPEESTRPQAIVDYLLSLGLQVTPKQHMTLEDLHECWQAGYPVIVPFQEYGLPETKKASFDYGHYVTVLGVALGYVFVGDPSIDNVLEGEDADAAKGRMMIPILEWLSKWWDTDADGNKYERYGIIVGPAKEHSDLTQAAQEKALNPDAQGDLFGSGGWQKREVDKGKPANVKPVEKAWPKRCPDGSAMPPSTGTCADHENEILFREEDRLQHYLEPVGVNRPKAMPQDWGCDTPPCDWSLLQGGGDEGGPPKEEKDLPRPWQILNQIKEAHPRKLQPSQEEQDADDFFFYAQAYHRWRNHDDVLGERRLKIAMKKKKTPQQAAMQNDREWETLQEEHAGEDKRVYGSLPGAPTMAGQAGQDYEGDILGEESARKEPQSPNPARKVRDAGLDKSSKALQGPRIDARGRRYCWDDVTGRRVPCAPQVQPSQTMAPMAQASPQSTSDEPPTDEAGREIKPYTPPPPSAPPQEEHIPSAAEQRWLSSNNPSDMLTALDMRNKGDTSERKLRLFACACCRNVWGQMQDPLSRKAVEVAEAFAEGRATAEELEQANDGAWTAVTEMPALGVEETAAQEAERYAADAAIYASVDTNNFLPRRVLYSTAQAAENAGEFPPHFLQAQTLRDIFGNPYYPAQVNPEWLSWNNGTIPKMAKQIYNNRDWEHAPILADALEEAGCDDPRILEHLRDPETYFVPGDWVFDLLLNKS